MDPLEQWPTTGLEEGTLPRRLAEANRTVARQVIHFLTQAGLPVSVNVEVSVVAGPVGHSNGGVVGLPHPPPPGVCVYPVDENLGPRSFHGVCVQWRPSEEVVQWSVGYLMGVMDLRAKVPNPPPRVLKRPGEIDAVMLAAIRELLALEGLTTVMGPEHDSRGACVWVLGPEGSELRAAQPAMGFEVVDG